MKTTKEERQELRESMEELCLETKNKMRQSGDLADGAAFISILGMIHVIDDFEEIREREEALFRFGAILLVKYEGKVLDVDFVPTELNTQSEKMENKLKGKDNEKVA